MARSESVGHSDPDTRKRKSSIGALATMKARPGEIRSIGNGKFEQNIELQGGGFGFRPRNLDASETASIGRLAQPTASEPPPRDNEEFQARVQRNHAWTSSPEVQAALMQFALGMTAPVNSPGDFLNNITRGIGGGFQAASRVHEGTLEEQTLAQEMALKERKMKVDEAQLGLQERTVAVNEAELNQKLKKGTTSNIVVSAENPLNAKFKLGIPAGSNAKVAVTVNDAGEITGASVEAGFEGGGSSDKDSPLAQLQKDRAEAIARGDTKAADELDLQIAASNAGATGTSTDTRLVPDPDNPGKFKTEVIPGSKTALKQKEDEEAAASRNAHGLVAAGIVSLNAKEALRIIDENPMPNLTVTGIGGLFSTIPGFQDSRKLGNALQAIKSNVTIETLTAMRQASPTGAAVGNVSDYEDRIMQTALGTLDQFGDAQQLADNVRRVNSTMQLIVNGDQIKRIGEQVKAGILTPEQGIAEVEGLINADVAKAAAAKQAVASEKTREATRGGEGLQPGPDVSPRLTSPEMLSEVPGRMAMTPQPVEIAPALTADEQNQVDASKQIEAMIAANKLREGGKDDTLPPTMPEGLNETQIETFNELDSDDERRVYIQALEMAKKKKKPSKTGTGAPMSDIGKDLAAPLSEGPLKEIQGHNAPKHKDEDSHSLTLGNLLRDLMAPVGR